MKKYKKKKFKFRNNKNQKVLGKEGDVYFTREWKFIKKYPFFIYDYATYKLNGKFWIKIK